MLAVNRFNGQLNGRTKAVNHGWLRGLLLGALALSFIPRAMAEAQLTDTSFVALPGNRLEVKLDFDQSPPAPRAYMIDSPPRLILDFQDASNQVGARQVDIKSGQVDSINFAEAQGRLRVVTNLNEPVDYRTFTEGNSLLVEFAGSEGSPVKRSSAPVAQSATPAAASPAPMKADETRVQGIDFQRVEGGQGRVIIAMTNDEAGLDIIEEGNNVVVNLIGAQLARDMEQRVDVQDFATPVMFIDSMSSGNNTSILIRPTNEPYDYMAYQTGNQLVLDFKPLTPAEQADAERDRFPYSGEKIDLNFQDVAVRSILQIIAEVAEMNLVISDNVDQQAGNITLRLKNVPWDQALDIILKTKGLAKRESGNVLLIGTAQEIADRERQELESQKQVEELAPLVTEFIQIDYRSASELKDHIEAAKLVSERGFVLADDQTNVLMIRETAAQIEEIRRTLRRFDVEVAQIMIEARIVTANTDFTKNLGVRWGIADNGNLGDVTIGKTAAIGTGTATAVPGLNVDLGTASNNTFAIGISGNSALLAAQISALESDGRGEVISQPKVITTNGKPAMIKSGQEIGYQTVEDNDVQVEWKDVVLGLEVTPQLNPGDRISLDLKINQDTIGDTLSTGELSLNTNELETSVVVSDGETVVLGGVFQEESRNDVDKIPFFGDLPVVGAAFRSKVESRSKNELLIFITPKLVRNSLTVKQ
ncbi:MAG: pilus assembly protein PilQ [Oceanospirillaceae bacterium]|nr:pilus assembly protein PilQ [Oceanospirillaceae bacterium]